MDFSFQDYTDKARVKELYNQGRMTRLNEFVSKWSQVVPPRFRVYEADELYIYPVPIITNDDIQTTWKIRPKPFNLATDAFQKDCNLMSNIPLGKDYRTHPMTKRLYKLRELLKEVSTTYHIDWIGIYRIMCGVESTDTVLVKEVYKGEMTRPTFPLDDSWVNKSSVTCAGLTGNVIYIQNLQIQDSQHYVIPSTENCESSLTLPIFGSDGFSIIGVLDTCSYQQNAFNDELIIQLSKIAYDLSKQNLWMPLYN
ncbi:hypothetical protein WA158_001934 [Blastocystis sp. Blastoise]